MARRQLTDFQKDYISNALQSGISNREIARDLGISAATVSNYRNAASILPKGQAPSYTKGADITRDLLHQIRGTVEQKYTDEWNKWSLIPADDRGIFPKDIQQQIESINDSLGLDKDAKAGYAVVYRVRTQGMFVSDAILDFTSQKDWREFYAK